jgi:hypothetical protein
MSNLSRLVSILAVLVPLAGLADEPVAGSAGQASRLAVDKNPRTHSTTISVSREIPIEIQTTIKGHSCDPTMAIRYEQRNTVARVEATIENPSCAACSGEYTIGTNVDVVSVRAKSVHCVCAAAEPAANADTAPKE